MLKDRLQNKRLAVSQMAFRTRNVSEISRNGPLVTTIGLGPAKLKESLMMTLMTIIVTDIFGPVMRKAHSLSCSIISSMFSLNS